MTARVLRSSADNIELPMTMPDGRRLVFVDVGLALTVEDERLVRCTLEVSVPSPVYDLIDELEMFHLEPEHRGQFHEGEFDPDLDVDLELELSTPEVARLAGEIGTNHATAIGYLMRLADERPEGEPLLDGNTWYAVRVKQARGGGLSTGYATTWATADRLP